MLWGAFFKYSVLQSKLNNSPQHRGAQHGGAAAAAVDMENILVNVACPSVPALPLSGQ